MRRTAWVPSGVHDAPLELIDLGDGTSSINQRQLRRHGLAGWQAETTAGLLAAWDLTSEHGVFFDVGANGGVYSLLCRLRWPSMTAIAFEPSPDSVTAGRRWAQANQVEIVFEQVALSDTEGHAPLHLSKKSDASHSLVKGFRESSEALTVELTTVDAYVERTGLAPTVMKIDVERHEPAVLRGAHTTLETHRPVVVMEVLDRASTRAGKRLQALGYDSHRLSSRDCLYWPGALPSQWQPTYEGWLEAVRRCGPRAVARRQLRAVGRWFDS